jgi:alanine racemase
MAYIEINKQNLYYNLNQIALKTGSVDKISVVLKDNAYGHGLEIIAKLCSQYGIKHAVVKNYQEALCIKNYFQTILVLNDKPICDDKVSFAINSLEDISLAKPNSKVELKVDTGMHRNGIDIAQLDIALSRIKSKNLNLIGVMTHYRSADVLSSELFWQMKQFDSIKQKLKTYFDNIRCHSNNSAALLRQNRFNEDLVRVGIGIYGYNELPQIYNKIDLKPVMKLYAKKKSTRVIKKGCRIGYGGDFIAPKDMIVSTYDLGYGDGWSRAEYTDSYVTPKGYTFLGRVSMDFVSVDSDDDSICIFDNAQVAAKQLKTISYEIFTTLSSSIPRVII